MNEPLRSSPAHGPYFIVLYFKQSQPKILENQVALQKRFYFSTINEYVFLFETCYRPQKKFTKVMFSQVSVCPQGGICPIACWDTPPPWADTPVRSVCWDMVNKRAVRIPLECILVQFNEFNDKCGKSDAGI